MSTARPGSVNARWLAIMPAVFVLLWSTGFVVARYAMPHAPPFKFLTLRYGLSVLCFATWVKASGLRFPADRRQWAHLALTGVLMHGFYLGGIWSAVKLGLGAGTTALIVGLQPVLTALWTLGARRDGAGAAVTRGQWCGLTMGFAGMALVVSKKLGVGEGTLLTVGLAVVALAGITAGTLYQKAKVQPCDVRVASLLQLSAAAVVTAPLAALEEGALHAHPELLGALAWSVLALTVGASSMLYLLIQKGVATQVTSLLYLVPPCTAVLAWLLFDEALNALTVIGTAVTVAGVALVTRSAPAAPGPAPSRRG